MMAEMTFVGLESVTSRVAKVMTDTWESIANAFEYESELTVLLAKSLTPVDTGELRKSGRVTMNVTNREISATITFGDEVVTYAWIVHEDLTATHRVGQAKFLETAVTQMRQGLLERIAIRTKLGGS